jgi:hypothetical protein
VRRATATRFLRRLFFPAKSVASMHPGLYLPAARRIYRDVPDRVVGPDTELVIEGSPRSGNTFVVAAFELAQRRPVRVVHHLHAAAQVLDAVRRGIPTLVLIRRPVDSAISHMIREPWISPRQALLAWIRFYGPLVAVRERILLVPFERATHDLGSVIREVNRRFDTAFDEFRHTDDNVARVFEVIERGNRANFGLLNEITVARPSRERDERKRELRRTLEHRNLASLRARAESIHDSLLSSDVPT